MQLITELVLIHTYTSRMDGINIRLPSLSSRLPLHCTVALGRWLPGLVVVTQKSRKEKTILRLTSPSPSPSVCIPASSSSALDANPTNPPPPCPPLPPRPEISFAAAPNRPALLLPAADSVPPSNGHRKWEQESCYTYDGAIQFVSDRVMQLITELVLIHTYTSRMDGINIRLPSLSSRLPLHCTVALGRWLPGLVVVTQKSRKEKTSCTCSFAAHFPFSFPFRVHPGFL
uniref:Uncharacterized protein n=1 Tax=Oryza barthii TaxID=65489 RepID=A0A0D3HGY4_9ORYZ